MLLPIKTERAPRRQTVVTYWLIGACVVVFLLQSVIGRFDDPHQISIIDRCLLQFPIGMPQLDESERIIALDNSPDFERQFNPGGGFRIWQVLTYQFLHGDTLHLLFNMLFLWVFGPPVEDRLGRAGFFGFYLCAGMAAAGAHALFAAELLETSLGPVRVTPPVLGASGSIAGVTGAFLVLFPRVRIRCFLFFFIIGFIDIPAWVLIAFAVMKDLFMAGGGGAVAYEAHLGGYAFGAAISAMLISLGILSREPMYDLVSLWRHSSRRRTYQSLVRKHGIGDVARSHVGRDAGSPETTDAPDPTDEARRSILVHIRNDRQPEATAAYLNAAGEHGQIWLGRDPQLAMGQMLTAGGHHADAAAVYELFLQNMPSDREAAEVRVLLALICARRLNDPVRASALLSEIDERALPENAAQIASNLREELG
ncbi:MAG: rhomboid family intramembrane serine protease [Planctomycetota bacterium]